jgi:hypothetical protein
MSDEHLRLPEIVLDRDKAYAETRILRQDPDGFTIAVPLTAFAAKWWGVGTKWDTAAEESNQFWEHHTDGPLIIMVVPELGERGKFQMWLSEYDFEFMDAADQAVSAKVIEENWGRFEGLVQAAMSQNGDALQFVPRSLRTDEFHRSAVAQNGRALLWIAEYFRTEELCRLAVQQNGAMLWAVPDRLRTEEICRIAVDQYGGSLSEVPDLLRTEEICRMVLEQDGEALAYVPEYLRTPELCRRAVERWGMALVWVPEKRRTPELCRVAVAQNGWALPHMPAALVTTEILRLAVEQNGHALQYAPNHLRAEMAPFARQKEVLPATITWDITMLDRLQERISLASCAEENVLRC